MALNNSASTCVEPCLRERNSADSDFLEPSNFGECYCENRDFQYYPCLIPIFNGTVLNIQQDLIRSSLSGISVKHYYGKCYKEGEKEESHFDERSFEGRVFRTSFDGERTSSLNLSVEASQSNVSSEETESFVFRDKPACMQRKLNFRNSFWNLHRPELCKLTWPQNYVSAATVTKYLHDHLTSHGSICDAYHAQEGMINMLKIELDEYGRLKELAPPREIPPDEKFFDFQMNSTPKVNPKCKGFPINRKALNNNRERFLMLNDEEIEDKKVIHRSNEEFCLTIGRHYRKPHFEENLTRCDSTHETPELFYSAEEEGGPFYFSWFQYNVEELPLEETIDESSSESDLFITLKPPRPPLALDEFCRAAGKVDFSDLRCNPDDF